MKMRIGLAALLTVTALSANAAYAQDRWSPWRAAGNSVTVEQRGHGLGAAVSQIGAGNSAGVSQRGQANTAVLQQNGDHNRGQVVQRGAAITGTLIQNGSHNQGCLVQYGDNLTGVMVQNGGERRAVTQTNAGVREYDGRICGFFNAVR
jgi:hypothetical protein